MTIPTEIGKKLAARRPDLTARLSAREREVLEHALTGATAPQIAKRLFRSPTTVVTHLEHIYRRVGVTQRTQLILAFAVMEAA